MTMTGMLRTSGYNNYAAEYATYVAWREQTEPEGDRFGLLPHLLGVLGKVAQLGDDVSAVLLGSGVEGIAEAVGKHGASRVLVADDPALEAPLPQPRVDVLAKLVESEGFDSVVFGASVLAADVAAGLAARLDAGLNWDLVDLELRDGKLIGKRPALGDSVIAEVGWKTEPRLALIRSGTFEPSETGGSAETTKIPVEIQDFSKQAVMVEQAHEESQGPSIEDADVIVAGGRGLGQPENFSLVEDLAKALGGAVAATRAVVDAGWIDGLAGCGWIDAFRHLRATARAYTWYSPNGRNGFRIDQAFVNAALLARLERAAYVWARRAARRDGLSDHAALLVDLTDMGAPTWPPNLHTFGTPRRSRGVPC